MPPTIISPGFLFRLQSFPKVTPVKPLYLTNNGEGKQLTIEEETNQPNQLVSWYSKCVPCTCPLTCSSPSQWNIKPPLPGEYDGSVDVIIIPPNKDSDYLAVSQDVVKSPDEVSLIKNLQVWTIKPIPDFDLFE